MNPVPGGMWFDGDDLNPIGQYATNPSQIHFLLKDTILYRFIISHFLVKKKKYISSWMCVTL